MICDLCLRGDAEGLRMALAAGLDPNSRDAHDVPALILAIEAAHARCVELLLDAGAHPESPEPSGRSPLVVALCAKRDLAASRQCVQALLGAGADPNRNGWLLLLAIEKKRPDCVEAILQAGADPDAVNTQGRSAIFAAASQRDYASLELLARAGANLLAIDAWGQNAKQWSSRWVAQPHVDPGESADRFEQALDRWVQWQQLNQAAQPAQGARVGARL